MQLSGDLYSKVSVPYFFKSGPRLRENSSMRIANKVCSGVLWL